MDNLLNQEQIAFLDILLFILGALTIVCGGIFIGSWLRPHRPNLAKLTSYESGEKPTNTAWIPFNVRFYGIGLLFLLFEVETILLFPWALVCTDPTLHQATNKTWVYYSSFIGASFILVLAIDLLYAYKQGIFTWLPKKSIHSFTASQVPETYYKKINQLYESSKHTQSTS
ncbi:MAG: NADH-quinone oxidoreductase subunit A [Burkholderiales bacterium]